MQDYEMDVLYEHKDKFIVKCDNNLGHLLKNKFTAGVKEKDKIQVYASVKKIVVRDKDTLVYETSKFPEAIYKTNSKIQKKSPSTFNQKLDAYAKFLISADNNNKYKEGEFVEKNNTIIKVVKIGRSFNFRNRNHNKVNTSFQDGDLVCFVYYTKDAPNWTAEDFLKAIRDYKTLINQIIKNGVKPRHRPELIHRLKGLPTICDGRKKFLGHSWIAIDDEDIWYFTYLLSSVEFDNNVKIGGKMAQCWRVSKRLIEDNLKEIAWIDTVIYKSNALPNINTEKNIIPSD